MFLNVETLIIISGDDQTERIIIVWIWTNVNTLFDRLSSTELQYRPTLACIPIPNKINWKVLFMQLSNGIKKVPITKLRLKKARHSTNRQFAGESRSSNYLSISTLLPGIKCYKNFIGSLALSVASLSVSLLTPSIWSDLWHLFKHKFRYKFLFSWCRT